MKPKAPEPRYITREAADSLIEKFKWTHESWMQDWPLEISDEIVVEDCIQVYECISDEDEKFLLMKAILYALDEVSNRNDFTHYSNQVSELLKKDFELHSFTVYYWTLYEDPEFEDFNITHLMQQVWQDNNKQ